MVPIIVHSTVLIIKLAVRSEVGFYNRDGVSVRSITNNSDQKLALDLSDLPIGQYFIRTLVEALESTEQIIFSRIVIGFERINALVFWDTKFHKVLHEKNEGK